MKIKSCLICIFLFGISTVEAQPTDRLQAAGEAMAAGNYFQAGILYERVLFDTPTDAVAFAAVKGRIESFKRQGMYAEAEHYIPEAMLMGFSTEQQADLFLQRIMCAYLSGQFENCLLFIMQFPVYYPGIPMPATADILKILSLNELQRWKEAGDAYLQWAEGKDSAFLIHNPYQKLPKFKSVEKAEWLSTFIPGAGQIYAGKPLEGMVSIVIQCAGLYYGVISYLDKYYLSIWAGVGVFGAFHNGGVRRAATLVNQYNNAKLSGFNKQVRRVLLEGDPGSRNE